MSLTERRAAQQDLRRTQQLPRNTIVRTLPHVALIRTATVEGARRITEPAGMLTVQAQDLVVGHHLEAQGEHQAVCATIMTSISSGSK
ncbi:unnamed protein product [Haemonchus placei]|uniref:Type VI secretion protein n=1 Tax=Haemonchus placei TaxID=6290 RepID=A0A0N4WR77_HAEPC|nr:unnamed protein product [Haemonchus placei]